MDTTLEKGMGKMLAQVNQFYEGILRMQDWPGRPRPLSSLRHGEKGAHLEEEFAELQRAYQAHVNGVADDETVARGCADACLDIIYVALGYLLEMGYLPGPAFDEVHRANMEKRPGETQRGHSADAVKPEGWQPPDLSFLHNVSPVHLQVARLRASKGRDYNSGPGLHDYFPFGHFSYAQMTSLKARRVESLLAVMAAGRQPNHEGLRDTLLDLINYATFYVEALDEGRLD